MDREGLVDEEADFEGAAMRSKICCYFTVEPIILAVLFSTSLTGSVVVNFLETVSCLKDFNLGQDNCTQPLSDQIEELVQPKTAYINSCVSIVQAVIPAVLSLFIGPWSDQNGRKPFLIISLSGFTVSYIVWGVLSYLPVMPIGYYLLPSVVLALSGGMVAINTCANCYISDISTERDRAFRLTLMSSVSLFGTVSGYLISAKVFSLSKTHGYSIIFFTAGFICLLALLYTLFFVAEIINKHEDRDRNLLNPKFVKEILLCVLEKRPGYSRVITTILISICFFMNYLIQGESAVKFLALKKAYSWTLENFNHFSAVSDTVCVVTSVVGIFILRKLLKVPDLWITVLAACVWCTSDVLLSFTKSSSTFWAFSLMGTFAALLGPTVTSEMSKSVPKHNLGKLFAFEATLEALTPFAAPPVYAALYTTVYKEHPLFIYLLSASFAALLGVLALVTLALRPFLKRDG